MTLMLPRSFGGRGHFISNQIVAILTFSIICLQKAVLLHCKCEQKSQYVCKELLSQSITCERQYLIRGKFAVTTVTTLQRYLR